MADDPKKISKTAQPSIAVLVFLVVLLLGAAIGLLFLQQSRPGVVGAYVLLSLAVAVVAFGFLRSTAKVTQTGQLGGAIAGFVVVLGMLLQFAGGEEQDVVGDLYIDGIPPGTAKVCILETDLRDDCHELKESDKGHFEFHGVRGLAKSVRFEVTPPGKLKPKVVEKPFEAGHSIRLELLASDFAALAEPTPVDVSAAALGVCRSGGSAGEETLYLFDLATTNLEAEKCNAFLNVLTFKLSRGIRAHLESYQLLTDTSFDLKRCSNVPVRQDAEARAAGQALGAPGVLWGFAEQAGAEVHSALSFTTLAGKPTTVFADLQATSDIAEFVKVDKPVDGVYLALASYLLGVRYQGEGKTELARRCFTHAKELGALTGEIAADVERQLQALGAGSVPGLTPIG